MAQRRHGHGSMNRNPRGTSEGGENDINEENDVSDINEEGDDTEDEQEQRRPSQDAAEAFEDGQQVPARSAALPDDKKSPEQLAQEKGTPAVHRSADNPNPGQRAVAEDRASVLAAEQPGRISRGTIVREGESIARRRAATTIPEPGYRRLHVSDPVAIKRPDGSTAQFRPDGSNCDVPGYYDIAESDIAIDPVGFGFPVGWTPTTPRHQTPPDVKDAPAVPDGMKRVHVVKTFTLSRDKFGGNVTYKANGTNCGMPGYYDMPEDEADHWYVRVHSENPPPALAPMFGTMAAVHEAQRRVAKRKLLEDALDQEEQEALMTVRRERADRLQKAKEVAQEVHMDEPVDGLAEYQSVRRVRAGRITEVVAYGCYVENADGTSVLREYPAGMTARYTPVVGDWWMVYSDGYQAISRPGMFEEGYKLYAPP